jgi:outer membrane protein TolC
MLAALAVLIAGNAGALDIGEVRELALANSRTLAQYNLRIRTGALDEKTQLYNALPSLSLGVSAGATLWNYEGEFAGDLSKDSLSAGLSFGLSQNLWDGGKNSINRQIRAIASDSARQDALAEYFSVLDQADSAYYAVLKAAASLAAAESSLETAGLSLSMAEIRWENKMIGDADYLQALAEKETRENSRNQARRDLSLAKLRLQRLTGLGEIAGPDPVDFAVYRGLIDSLAEAGEGAVSRTYALLWEAAAAKNPGLVKAALNTGRAEKDAALAARDYSPTLSLSLSTGLNYNPAGELKPQDGKISLSGRIPLDLWVTAANVEKKKIAQEDAALAYRGTLSALDIDLQTALLDLIAQAGQVLSSGRALEYAEKRFEYVLELYRLSRNSPSELSDAETLVRTNRNQLNNARYALLSALSKLRSLGAFESEEALTDLLLRGLMG